jgi:hypothetical protein
MSYVLAVCDTILYSVTNRRQKAISRKCRFHPKIVLKYQGSINRYQRRVTYY